MRPVPTALLVALSAFPLATAAGGECGTSPEPMRQEATQPPALAELCASFSGAESLPGIEKALQSGESPNTAPPQGDSPLLILCRLLNDDDRYRSEPAFAQALETAIEMLIRHGADTLRENAAGCNAIFYLQGRQPLYKALDAEKLLPRELAVRIPHDEAALLRYMRLRVAQAGLAQNDASRAYLIRRYCTPAYSRADKLLGKYLGAEMRRRIPLAALEDTLAFMRLANSQEAQRNINSLSLWEHGEHFLEEVPEHILQTLELLGWDVAPELLEKALDKLDSMLPKTDGDMIDCNAGYPMAMLLEMRAKHRDNKLPALLQRFSGSRDSRLAYTALSLQLRERNLPLPEPETLAGIFCAENGGAQNLPEPQRRLLECATVDSAVRNAELSRLNPDTVRRTRQTLLDMGLPRHAALLAQMVDDEGLTVGEESLRGISDEYNQLPAPAPQAELARYILAHPELFRTPAP